VVNSYNKSVCCKNAAQSNEKCQLMAVLHATLTLANCVIPSLHTALAVMLPIIRRCTNNHMRELQRELLSVSIINGILACGLIHDLALQWFQSHEPSMIQQALSDLSSVQMLLCHSLTQSINQSYHSPEPYDLY